MRKIDPLEDIFNASCFLEFLLTLRLILV